MARRESDCGEACRALNERQRRFHLEVLAMGLPGGPGSLTECYTNAGYSGKGTIEAVRSSASRLHSSANVRNALASHRDAESARVGITRQEVAEIHAKIARTGHLTASELATVEDDGSVILTPWSEVDPEKTRGVSVEAGQYGPKLKMPPLSAANAAAAELRKLYGWDAPREINITGRAELMEALGFDPEEDPDAAGDEVE